MIQYEVDWGVNVTVKTMYLYSTTSSASSHGKQGRYHWYTLFLHPLTYGVEFDGWLNISTEPV